MPITPHQLDQAKLAARLRGTWTVRPAPVQREELDTIAPGVTAA